jgi:hypothetical protein
VPDVLTRAVVALEERGQMTRRYGSRESGAGQKLPIEENKQYVPIPNTIDGSKQRIWEGKETCVSREKTRAKDRN